MVSFDVKGAFNGVNQDVLTDIMKQMGLPTQIVRWTASFYKQRKACISLPGFNSPVEDILQAGLPQGSPASPVLYGIYNSQLVQSDEGQSLTSIGYADDYSTWVVSKSLTDNLKYIQDVILPRAQRWTARTGATFEPTKTALIHFTRNYTLLNSPAINTPVQFLGHDIHPQHQVKVLGVTLDQKLSMKDHISKATAKATKACLAVGRLKGLSPAQSRQLYSSAVIPIMDYAASSWFTDGMTGRIAQLKLLERVQRLGAQAIVKSFRSVSLEILQVESGLLPTTHRLQLHMSKSWCNLHTMPKDHPFWKLIRNNWAVRLATPFREMRNITLEEMESFPRHSLESIIPAAVEPWAKPLNVIITQDRDQAKTFANECNTGIRIYTDGSGKNGTLGAAAIVYIGNNKQLSLSRSETYLSIGFSNVYVAELYGIFLAVHQIRFKMLNRPSLRGSPITIFTDNQAALRSLINIRHQSGQFLLLEIRRLTLQIQKHGSAVEFR